MAIAPMAISAAASPKPSVGDTAVQRNPTAALDTKSPAPFTERAVSDSANRLGDVPGRQRRLQRFFNRGVQTGQRENRHEQRQAVRRHGKGRGRQRRGQRTHGVARHQHTPVAEPIGERADRIRRDGLHHISPDIEQPRDLRCTGESEAGRQQLRGGEDQQRVRKIARAERPDGGQIASEIIRQAAEGRSEPQRRIRLAAIVADEKGEAQHGEHTGNQREPEDHAKWRRGIIESGTRRPGQQGHAE